jgi:hypothetical protein
MTKQFEKDITIIQNLIETETHFITKIFEQLPLNIRVLLCTILSMNDRHTYFNSDGKQLVNGHLKVNDLEDYRKEKKVSKNNFNSILEGLTNLELIEVNHADEITLNSKIIPQLNQCLESNLAKLETETFGEFEACLKVLFHLKRFYGDRYGKVVIFNSETRMCIEKDFDINRIILGWIFYYRLMKSDYEINNDPLREIFISKKTQKIYTVDVDRTINGVLEIVKEKEYSNLNL